MTAVVEAPEGVTAIVMPKWGLSMKEGTVVEWLVDEGDTIAVGDLLAEVETDKINGEVEATDGGVLRRIVAAPESTHRVQALLAVLAEPSVDDAVVDAFIAEFPEPPEDDEADGGDSPYRTVTVGDMAFRYTQLGEIGDGPTTVLIHGFGGDLDNWLFNIGPLAEHGPVVALDLPGHGESSLSVADPSPNGFASAVWSALDELGVGDIAAVGHSMGAAVATAMALSQPGRVRSLALLAPAGLGDEINQEYLDDFVAARSKREMKAVATTLFADADTVTRSMIDGMLRYKRVDGVADLLATIRDAWFTGGKQRLVLTDRLAGMSTPVLVVFGAEDRVIPASHGASLDAATNVAVHVLDGAGHMVQMEKAGEVNRLLTDHAPTS